LLLCIVCGQNGVADVIRNILLFAPLGAALALAGAPFPRIALTGMALSAFVEGAQLFIPGRDPSLGDVTFNTLGALSGAGLVHLVLRYAGAARPPVTRVAAALAVLAVAAIAGTGYLLQPSYPQDSDYYGQWTPNLGHLEWYRGRVLAATLGPLPLPSRRLDDTPTVRALLTAGATLHVRALAGPPVPRLASLFSIYDGAEREILLVGPDRDDLVLRVRTRAVDWRLDQPDVRLRGAMRTIAPHDTIDLSVWRDGEGWCLTLNGQTQCGLAFSPGVGWAIVMYPDHLPQWLISLLGACWLGGLMLPASVASRKDRAALLCAAAIAAAGLLAVPALTQFHATLPFEWLGAAAGFAAGTWLYAQIARMSALRQRSMRV
jgi:hypothetical protein